MKKLCLNIEDYRGQSYDNASNMSGWYASLPAQLKQITSLAEYVPCAAHSMNLVATASVSCFLKAVNFLSSVQQIYTFSAASMHQWTTLTEVLAANVNRETSNTKDIVKQSLWGLYFLIMATFTMHLIIWLMTKMNQHDKAHCHGTSKSTTTPGNSRYVRPADISEVQCPSTKYASGFESCCCFVLVLGGLHGSYER